MLATLFAGTLLAAQTNQPQLKPAFAGDCAVVVALSGQRIGDLVQVTLDLGRLPEQTVNGTALPALEVPTGSPLQKGQKVRLSINGSDVPGGETTVEDSTARPASEKPTGVCASGGRSGATQPKGDALEASAYFGWAYDQFAPDSIGGYPPGTATEKHNRVLFGVDFDYRMLGSDTSKARLWLAGETLHGVRSADVDCSAETNKPPACNPQAGITYARAVLKDASSVEAYIQPRLEIARLQKGTSAPAQLYLSARFGFIGLDEAPRVYKNHQFGVGLMADDGPFKGSTLEFGWGMNEMLSDRKWKRLKVDGLLTFSLDGVPAVRDRGRFFIEMFIDNDLRGPTADSVQVFMGFDLDIRKFFGGS